MIHPFTLACALLAVGSGAWVYQSKHSAQMLDRDINQTLKRADDTRSRAGMLRAEYALLNDPTRLQDLADAHLSLKTVTPGQFVNLADLGRKLPAIGLPKAAEPTQLPELQAPLASQPIAAAEPQRARVPVAAATPPAPPATAASMASAATVHALTMTPVRAEIQSTPLAPPPGVAAARPRAVVPAPAVVVRAPALPRPSVTAAAERTPEAAPRALYVAPAAAWTPQPAYREPAYRAARNEPPPATPAEAIARIARGGPVDPSVPVVASALGMARSMTPAAPIGSASAAAYDPRGSVRN